jgi:DNA-binding winged helix-turn-helix (wHTH) protein
MNSSGTVFLFRFGIFELDAHTGELRKHGLRVSLRPQAVKLLLFLLEDPGKMRTREELQRRLWPESKSMDFSNSLNKAVHALRDALGDSASSPRFIETIAGRGYRFIVGLQPSKKIESVAVLPFAADSSEPDLNFVRNQITSGIINALSSKAGVHVLAHSTVKSYKPQDESPQAIGKTLDVDAVLIGELSLHQTDLFLNVEFVDATDGTQLWGAHLKEHWGAEIDAAQRLIKEVLYGLLPVLIPSPTKIMPISSKPRALPIRKVSGIRN